MSTVGLPRFNQRTAPRTRNAALLQVSVETYEELASPLGRVRPVTLARVRQRIVKLQQEQEQETA